MTETSELQGRETVAKSQPRTAGGGGLDFCEIPVDRITPDPDQPRTEFDPDALQRLAKSLLSHGLIQPITVREGDEPFHYVIVAGERRWRAAKLAGLPTLAAVVIDGPRAGSRKLETQLIENALREDLSPIEQARAFQTLMSRNVWSARKLALTLHLHHTTVTRALSLLELPEDIQDDVDSGRVAPSVAREIARLDDPAEQRLLAERVAAEGLSRHEVVDAMRQVAAPAPAAPTLAYRIFEISIGRVIIEGEGLHDPYVIAGAITEVGKVIQKEMSAISSAVHGTTRGR